MKRSALSMAMMAAAAMSAAVAAQSGGSMSQTEKMSMKGKLDMTYTGCVEAGEPAGTFTLTHVSAEDHMGKDVMKNDMKHDAMAPSTLNLTAKSVPLGHHVGRKVSVTGSLAPMMTGDAMGKDAMSSGASSFTVKALKVIAASCS